MTDLPDIRVGDRVRWTEKADQWTANVEGVVEGDSGTHLDIAGYGLVYLSGDGVSVEVLERALPPEPEIGSVVVLRRPDGRVSTFRRSESGYGWWWDGRYYTWAEVCAVGTLLVVVHADASVEVVA